jgi:hypothetical protein
VPFILTFFVVRNVPLLPSLNISASVYNSAKRCACPFLQFLSSSKPWRRPVCTLLARLLAIFPARHGELHLRRNGPHGPLLYNHGPLYGPGSGHILTDILSPEYVRGILYDLLSDHRGASSPEVEIPSTACECSACDEKRTRIRKHEKGTFLRPKFTIKCVPLYLCH